MKWDEKYIYYFLLDNFYKKFNLYLTYFMDEIFYSLPVLMLLKLRK